MSGAVRLGGGGVHAPEKHPTSKTLRVDTIRDMFASIDLGLARILIANEYSFIENGRVADAHYV